MANDPIHEPPQENTILDRIAFRFECDWNSTDTRPQIEGILEAEDNLAPSLVLRECLIVELQLRRREGEDPVPEEYFRRFPDHESVVRQVFNETLVSQNDTRPIEGAEFAGVSVVEGRASLSRIGQYSVVKTLGQGGFGTVYLAQHTLLPNRRVAIKVPRADRHISPQQLAMLLAEARTVSDLNHPNIVQVIDVYQLGPDGEIQAQSDATSIYAVVMEYVDGQSLADIVGRWSESPLDIERTVDVVATTADTVAFVHAHDYFHRDLKPGNILFAKSGELKIADFGFALHASQQGSFGGTPSYMSPEQVEGKEDITGGTDIWSMGVILYQLLTGRLPFGSPGDNLQLFKKILNHDPRPPSEINPSIPPEVARVCLKCLQKDRLQRFLSASELAGALRGALVDRRAAAGAAVAATASPEPSPQRPSQSPPPGETVELKDSPAEAQPCESTRTSSGFTLVSLPGGEFAMGAGPTESVVASRDELPQHRVALSPFALSATPVTCEQYSQVMGIDVAAGQRSTCPVTRVSWTAAIRFCNKLSEMEGLAPYYDFTSSILPLLRRESIVPAHPETDGYRLPTEAEWEYACRSGEVGMWCSGDDESQLHKYACFGQTQIAAAGQYAPNAWGLYDMHGNVWEWCWDVYHKRYYQRSPGENPLGAEHGPHHVLRGGAFYSKSRDVRSARRSKDDPSREQHDVGFRLARSLPGG